MKVYYDTKIDQLVLVSKYQASNLFSYLTEIMWSIKKEKPAVFKNLVYIGEFGTGEIYYE
jgi:hypothetical protein